MIPSRLLLASFLLFGLACGDDAVTTPDAGPLDAGTDAGTGPHDWPSPELPTRSTREGVSVEMFMVPGVVPPPNPESGEATPADLNFSRVVRYRVEAETPVPVRAIVVAVPGTLSGALSYDGLARALVRRAQMAGEPIEVWSLDRRANLLEDLKGMNAAEAAGDPRVAEAYYFGDDTVGGESFGGFLTEASYVSEWGLATHAGDLQAVLALIPEDVRRDRVFLMGHSIGAVFVEAFSAWRFEDGSRAADELAGVILVDGALRGEPQTEEQYLAGGVFAGIAPSPGLSAIRGGETILEIPILGSSVLARSEIGGMDAFLDPDGVLENEGRDETVALLLEMSANDVPAMTNEAALGLLFDAESTTFYAAAMRLGQPTGGSIVDYNSLVTGGVLSRPGDPDATYSWVDAPDADPVEITPIQDLARALHEGPTNLVEWYFPQRLALDVVSVGGTDVPEDDWQATYGLRVFDRELMDAPVLALGATIIGEDGFDTLSTRMSPTVGEGRPHAGATRDEDMGLRVVYLPDQAHFDPIMGPDTENNPVPMEVLSFVQAHSVAGAELTIAGDPLGE